MKKHLAIKIYGMVQGVLYRFSAKEHAEKLSIAGRAKNAPDGSVEIEAEGEEKELVQFLEWCKKGPSTALVKKTEHRFSDDLQNYEGFTVEW